VLPSISQPPHDPTWVDLDARLGWRAALVEPAGSVVLGDVITLAVDAGARRLDEPSGSFGGLTTPSLAAVAPDGSVYLLDPASGMIKRFDRCDCAFVPIPCTGGVGTSARQVDGARAIAISRGNLFVCDTGNRRVTVFTLRELVLRWHWRAPLPGSPLLPPDSPVVAEWQPPAVAANRRGELFVADAANGCLHRFSSRGRWLGAIAGTGDVTALTIDREGCLYIRQAGHAEVFVYSPNGERIRIVTTVAEIAALFPRLHIEVDPNGDLRIAGCGTFDHTGALLPPAPAQPPPKHVATGRFITKALDSALYRCQWHRVIINGRVPAGTSIAVATYAAEVELPDETIAALPLEAWSHAAVARAVCGEWDCLIRGPRGRFLWLALSFTSGNIETPCIEKMRIEFPRIPLRRYLPAVFGNDLSASEFTDRFLSIFDTTFRSVERQIDTEARLFDARTTPAKVVGASGIDFLTWLASWVGITLDRRLPEAQRRRFLRAAPALYDVRATRNGLWRLLLAYLGLPAPPARCAVPVEPIKPTRGCRAVPLNCAPPPPRRAYEPPPLLLEHFQLRRWLFVGTGRLGEDAKLWGRRIVNRSALDANAQTERSQLITTPDPTHDPFRVYASRFSVFVPACVGRSDRQRKNFENLLRAESPAHTAYTIEYVEPRLRIGIQSMIGLDAVVGRYPSGVALRQATLGRGTVLGESADGMGSDGRVRPSLRIGSRSQVGTTTRLD
jgi:phage tail-like protein